jgi:hypothetical protein
MVLWGGGEKYEARVGKKGMRKEILETHFINSEAEISNHVEGGPTEDAEGGGTHKGGGGEGGEKGLFQNVNFKMGSYIRG